MTLTIKDEPGFWEGYGYHNRGDPWLEQRYHRRLTWQLGRVLQRRDETRRCRTIMLELPEQPGTVLAGTSTCA